MKKIKTVLATFILAGLTLTSCGSDDNGGGTPIEISGKWNPTKTVTKVGNTSATQNYEGNQPGCDKDYQEFIGTTNGSLRDVVFVDGQNGCQEDEGPVASWTKNQNELAITGGDFDGNYDITKLTRSDLVITDEFEQSGQVISITYHFKKAPAAN